MTIGKIFTFWDWFKSKSIIRGAKLKAWRNKHIREELIKQKHLLTKNIRYYQYEKEIQDINLQESIRKLEEINKKLK